MFVDNIMIQELIPHIMTIVQHLISFLPLHGSGTRGMLGAKCQEQFNWKYQIGFLYIFLSRYKFYL